jgi:hypothetical protein
MLRIFHILLHKIFIFCAVQLLNSIKKERGKEKYTIISTSEVSRSRVVRKPENHVASRMRVMWRCRGRWFLKRSVKVILCWFIETPSKLSSVVGQAAVQAVQNLFSKAAPNVFPSTPFCLLSVP